MPVRIGRTPTAYRTLLSSHQDVSESEQIDIYLDALQHHKDPSILYEVKAFRAKVKRTNATCLP
jgi:hypothetical protein